ncbi:MULTISPECIES: hypothetical protein [Pseudomonas]|uniref:hypothetical protein n=1 Tax=Pseudomonas TaxID=286 RepID=UPI0015E2F153|nr:MULTISPECIES: hypothetical protein [Pseudomonas]MBA1250323.1 hypothetical protein [Pseudomonas zeshuii]
MLFGLGSLFTLCGAVCIALGLSDPLVLLIGLGSLFSATPIIYAAFLNYRYPQAPLMQARAISSAHKKPAEAGFC